MVTNGDIGIFLLAENRLLRDTLARLLRKQAGISVATVMGSAENLRDQIVNSDCELVLTDSPPGSSNTLVLRDLLEENAKLKILLIGMDDDSGTFIKAVYLGAKGYVLKDASAAEIVAAVRSVSRGEAVCPPHMYMALMEHVRAQARQKPSCASSLGKGRHALTHRQVQLMSLVAKGLTNKEIAANLNLSQFTVKNHIRRVMHQLAASSRHDAVLLIRAAGQLTAQ
jgi:DNA-binding NarL/FixJ family response regulator